MDLICDGKIIIIGASGDTGFGFVSYCLENGIDSSRLIATGTRVANRFECSGVEYIQLDVSKKEDFSKLPDSGVLAVVLLAGVMPARMKGYDPQVYIDVTMTGTLNTLEYCRKANVDRILFAQSFGDIKDNGETDVLLKVDSPKNFSYKTDHSIYVICKNAAVELIEVYHQMYGIKRFIFRLPTIYSYSKERGYYVDGVLRPIGYKLLIDKARAGEDIEVWGDPSRVKDMVYVKDFAQMMFKACFVERCEGYYNVGTGIGTSLEDQIRAFIDVFDEKGTSKIIYRPDKPNAPQYIMDIEPAVTELGYEVKYPFPSWLYDYKAELEMSEK